MDLTPENIAKIKSYEFDLHSKLKYETQRWKELSHKDQISDFEDRDISRNDVLKAYTDYKENRENFVRPFILTMVWGFTKMGFGRHRTNNFLSSEEKLRLIKQGIDAVFDKDLKTAFSTLCKIKGLGISYISKILYFATKADGYDQCALIFDIRVSRALVKMINPTISEFLDIVPSKKFADYEKFNSFIHSLADRYDLEADSIELFFFDGKF